MAVLLEEFERGGVWTRVIAGSREALRALANLGVPLAVVSNADGTVAQQLRDDAICQVRPGPGVPVELVLDSAAVGVARPDPPDFRLPLRAPVLPAAAAVRRGRAPT